MPQGIGYGPQAVLAGEDGRSPAIDQLTGMPLTMEELIRRRGIVTFNPQQQQGMPQEQQPGGMSPNSGGMAPNAMGGASGGNNLNSAGGSPSVAGANSAASALANVPPGLLTEDDMIEAETAWALQAAGVGAATGLGYWLMNKLMKRGVPQQQAEEIARNIPQMPNRTQGQVPAVMQPGGMPAPVDGVMTGEDMGVPGRLPQPPIDGEYSVIEALAAPNQQLPAPNQQLPAPARQLATGQQARVGASGEASVAGALANRRAKRMEAGGRKGRAAQGSRGSGVIEQPGPKYTPAADRRTSATQQAIAERKAKAAKTQKRVPAPKRSPAIARPR